MRRIYSYEECKERALLYETRKALKENEPGIYNKINQKKWGKELFAHMKRLDNRDVQYTKEMCEQIVKKYEYLKEFREKEHNIYYIIHYHGWKEILLKLKPTGSAKKRDVYVYEFPEQKSAYVGITFSIQERDKAHHLKGSLFEWAMAHGVSCYRPKILENGVDFDQAGKREAFYMEKYSKNGWNLINRAKAGSLGGTILRKEKITIFTEDGRFIENGDMPYIEKKYNIKHNLARICLRKANKTTNGYQIIYEEEWEKMGKPLVIKDNTDKTREKKIAILSLDFQLEHVSNGKMEARKYLGLTSSLNCVTFIRKNLICNYKAVPQKWVCYYDDYELYANGKYEIYNPKIPKDKKMCFVPLNATQENKDEIVKNCFAKREWKKKALNRAKIKRALKKVIEK